MGIQKGKILIAQPFMMDDCFKQAVVFITDHGINNGSIGFILNKPIEMKINQLISDFPDFETQVFYGGPVATDTIHYLHNVGDILNDSIPITGNLFWGGNFEQLKALIDNKLILPQNIKFFIGYSGWSKGQLEEELERKSWLFTHINKNLVLRNYNKSLWRKVLEDKGDIYTVISQIPPTSNLN